MNKRPKYNNIITIQKDSSSNKLTWNIRFKIKRQLQKKKLKIKSSLKKNSKSQKNINKNYKIIINYYNNKMKLKNWQAI